MRPRSWRGSSGIAACATPEAAMAFLRPTLAQGLRSPLAAEGHGTRRPRGSPTRWRPASGSRSTATTTSTASPARRSWCSSCASSAASRCCTFRIARARATGCMPTRSGTSDAAGARVVVTADCGTANVAELRARADARARRDRLRSPPCADPTRPPAFAVLNPLRRGLRVPVQGPVGGGRRVLPPDGAARWSCARAGT